MKRMIVGLALLAAGCALVGCESGSGAGLRAEAAKDVVVEGKVLADELEEFRRAYLAVRNDKKVSEALSDISNKITRDTDVFECSLQRRVDKPNVLEPLLIALPHLKLTPGTMDCVLRGDMYGSQGQFVILDEGKFWELDVILDGSAESAWERVLLAFASRQFYLGWHANYGRAWILTDFSQFDSLVRLPAPEETLPERIRALAMKIDFTPRVSVSKGKALVSYVIFAPFGGFYREYVEVDMSTGDFTQLDDRTERLVKYCSPICY